MNENREPSKLTDSMLPSIPSVPTPVSSVTPQPRMPRSAHKVLDVHWPAPSTGLGYRVHCQQFCRDYVFRSQHTELTDDRGLCPHCSILYPEL